jgi:hypothetical protein
MSGNLFTLLVMMTLILLFLLMNLGPLISISV